MKIGPFVVLLDVVAGLLVLGLFLAGAYEAIAIVNTHIPFTKDLPLITTIVRPWVAQNKMWFLAISGVVFASLFWLFFHFVLPA